MKIKSLRLPMVAISFIFVVEGSALANDQCFSLFSGGATVEFNSPVTSSKPLSGRIFGSGLTTCDGLTAWPVFGSSFKNASGDIEVAFRTMTVDPTSCGAVDYLAPLGGNPLSGSAIFHNDRFDVSGTTTMTQVACPKPLPADEQKPAAHAGADAEGNEAN